ncbi:hypothetical protein EXIGLDRAFT_101611 [Exidia glandulosa HHB12029]|uniref:Uncharacterized protein n=1 Tax=Exidia glandulosa HHB12029 TaxID=1314781 RepID=A0A165H0N3_EXIGL|nr:hypothetical protein EXIGLDRAFT_101611 [Exidia glandulosa HHB12029]
MAIGVPRRWDTIRDIISFLRETEQPVAPHLPKEQSTLLEETFLCRSHTAAIQMLSERWNLLQDDLHPWLHRIGKFRYDDAPTCSHSDFIAFVTSCGHGVTPQLLIEWIGSVSHSRTLLYTSWERRALGPSRDHYDELSCSYLRQAEDTMLADPHRLDTVDVRTKLMAAYLVGDTQRRNEHHALRSWTWIVERNAITDAVLAHAINCPSNLSLLRRVWADSLRQGVVPSISTYARYAKKLICNHLYDEGFEILRDRVGDDPAFRYVAVALLARVPPGDVERYARELPKIWRDPRTQAEVVQARAHRRSEARRNQLWED